MKDITKKYSNGEVTIVWKPSVCIHSTVCWKTATGLPEVFNPREKPWINATGSTTEKIIEQVKKCPSGALSYIMDIEIDVVPSVEKTEITLIEATQNGPLLVHGNVVVKDSNGNLTSKEKITALCRCGGSSNKPYCDGTHRKNNFIG